MTTQVFPENFKKKLKIKWVAIGGKPLVLGGGGGGMYGRGGSCPTS